MSAPDTIRIDGLTRHTATTAFSLKNARRASASSSTLS